MNPKALYHLTYGVYFLSAREGEKDNACIINTGVQVANNPTRVSISVLKGNLTCDMIANTRAFNLSPITTEAAFSLFQHFGMQSGRTVDKFADFSEVARSANGLYYLTKWANAFLSFQVVESLDLGSHTMFIGELVDGEVLSDVPSCSYGYYQTTIKANAAPPSPAAPAASGKKWRCTVCGYIHEGETPPESCPLCHVPADKFVEVTE